MLSLTKPHQRKLEIIFTLSSSLCILHFSRTKQMIYLEQSEINQLNGEDGRGPIDFCGQS